MKKHYPKSVMKHYGSIYAKGYNAGRRHKKNLPQGYGGKAITYLILAALTLGTTIGMVLQTYR